MTHASLFSGIGGPELAAEWLGWKNLFHCEINPFGRQVLNYWFNKSESYENIKTTDFTKWRGRVDVLTGGFPCQPFSTAGKRKGADDDRYLWPEMLRAVDEIRPTWVVGENVAGIVSMVEPVEILEMGGETSMFGESENYVNERSRFTIERICKDLENHGYSVQPVLVPACAVGAPHKRDRIFIIGRIVNVNRRHNIKDSVSDGRENGEFKKLEHEELHGKPRTAGEDGQAGLDAADTSGERLSRRNGKGINDLQQRRRHEALYSKESFEATSDTSSEQGNRCKPVQQQYCGEKKKQFGRDRLGECYVNVNRAGLGRWDSFPSVSPVHRGNDGLSFDVSRLAIPFEQWRPEAIKACGNAIVPQVMYEIFRAIEISENETKQQSYD